MFIQEKQELIYWAKLLNERKLVTACSGNLSCRCGDKFLITGTGTYLGQLKEEDISVVDSNGALIEGPQPSTEKEMHLRSFREIPGCEAVIHSHSPFTTAFFHFFEELDIFSFEAKLYLSKIPVIVQETPTVTDVTPVIKALETSAIAVLKNHGVVAIGKKFQTAFGFIELLEEQARVNLLLRNKLTGQAVSNKSRIERQAVVGKKYKMLSKEHMEKLTEVVNGDVQVQELGKKYDLTCALAVKNDATEEVMRFVYECGRIVKMDKSEDADFVIVGSPDLLRKVFNREIDPFAAVTQGKVKTKGDFAKMSKWYPVMVRTFKLWEQAPVE